MSISEQSPRPDSLGTWATGGCGAKLRQGELIELLDGLAGGDAPPGLLLGLDHADDAAVLALDDTRALVTTLDFAPPMSNDPRLAGEMAAVNALNDVWACGGRPALGLNILGLPAEADLSSSRALLVAAAEAARAAGAVVVGGHTIRTPEPLYGLAVVGFVTPQAIWTISGAQAGDVVLLTKPLGTGVLISRARRDKDAARVMVELAGELTLSHGPAVDALRDVEVHAATDVSGFGLAGHAADLADASGVTLALRADGVPIYAQARSLLAQGHTTSLTADNERDMRGRVDVAPGLDRAQLGMLYDPQSAGPLLLVVAAADAVRAVAALRGAGCRAAVAIGRVSDRREASVEIRLSEPECPA